jgi:hypothetical protein
MRIVRVEEYVAVWEKALYDVPVPGHLSNEEARAHASRQVADGAWAPWHVEVGGLVDGGPRRTSTIGPLGLSSDTAVQSDEPLAA